MSSNTDTLPGFALLDDQFIIGTDGNDSLAGGDGDDTIIGIDGEDTIDGGGGNDELSGNRDDDTIWGGDGEDTILASGGDDIAGGGGGRDRLDGGTGNDTVDFSDSALDVEINLETERAAFADIAMTEFIFSFENANGGSGNDTLIGTAGGNRLDGGPGDDSIVGGDGNDTVTYANDTAGVLVDLDSGAATGPDSGDDTLAGIENAVGGSGDDGLFGNDADNSLEGNGGSDTLKGGGGNDSLDGGDGDDSIVAGAGDDVYEGGDGFDTLSFEDANEGVLVDMGTGTATGPETGDDSFDGIEKVVGGAGDDTLLGDDGDNALCGGGGDDSVAGNGGNDHLDGGDGNDFLDGGTGDDSLEGGDGDDTLVGDPGNDTLDGGPGDDTADYSGTDSGAVFDLGAGLVVLPDGTADHLISIENLIATQGDDTVFGTENGEFIDGQGGDDVLVGNGGDDTVLGGDGDDSIVAGSVDGDEGPDGDDVYDGGDGNDTISFEDITESVIVDLGNETATGAQTGNDTVTDIENVFGGYGDDTIVGDSEGNVLCGNDGDDIIDGADGDDTLIGGGGGDTIDGGDGNDLIYGDSAAGIGDVGLTIRFAGESAGFKNTYGVYNANTNEARLIVANVDVDTNPALAYFVTGLPLTADDFENLGFFLIPNGYDLNRGILDGGDPGDLHLEVFDDDGVWKVRDADSGYVFSGAGNAAYFTEAPKNAGGLDHTSVTGGLATGGQELQAWEDLPNLGDRDFDDTIFHLTLSCGLGLPGNDLLMGGAGDDTIFGNEEQDTLLGGTGNDLLDGNAGDDTLEGGAGSDTVHGGDGNDLILGSGSVEDDQYDGGLGNDTITYEDETEDVLVDLGAGMAAGAGIGDDDLEGIENAVGGSGDDTLIGSDADNQLTGNDGDDLLGGTGGNDVLDGGDGNDTVSYETTTAGVVVDLETGMATGPEIDTDILVSIENAFGGAGNDSLTGSGGANLLVGNAGDDTIEGAAGDDTLKGGDGDDLILSGDGHDLLTGGDGSDTFSFDLWTGTDTISDFTPTDCCCPSSTLPPSDKIDVTPFAFVDMDDFAQYLEPGRGDERGSTWIRLSEVGGGDVYLDDVNIIDLNRNDFVLGYRVNEDNPSGADGNFIGMTRTFSEPNVCTNDLLSFDILDDPTDAFGNQYGSVTNNDDGTFTFLPGDQFQFLDDGETRDVSFNYLATDASGASEEKTVTVTVVGSDDAPVDVVGELHFVTEDQSMFGTGAALVLQSDLPFFGVDTDFSLDADIIAQQTFSGSVLEGLLGGIEAIGQFFTDVGCTIAGWFGGCDDPPDIDLPSEITTPGVVTDGSVDLKAGLQPYFFFTSGDVDAEVPVNVVFTTPRQVEAGESFSIESAFTIDDGATFETMSPDVNFGLDFVFDLDAELDLVLTESTFGGASTIDIFDIDTADLGTHFQGELGEPGFNILNFSAEEKLQTSIDLGGLATLDVNFPVINTTGDAIDEDTLTSTGEDDVVVLDVDLDAVLAQLIELASGVPVTFGEEDSLGLEIDVAGVSVNLISVEYAWDLFAVNLISTLSAIQDFTLDIDELPLMATLEDGSTISGFFLGDDIAVAAPNGFDADTDGDADGLIDFDIDVDMDAVFGHVATLGFSLELFTGLLRFSAAVTSDFASNLPEFSLFPGGEPGTDDDFAWSHTETFIDDAPIATLFDEQFALEGFEDNPDTQNTFAGAFDVA